MEEQNKNLIAEQHTVELSTLKQDSLVGHLLGSRYRVVRQLGEGGFGAVYLATDEKMTSRNVVIKVLHKEQSSNEWSVKRFEQEMEALARVDHPAIVGIYDVSETDDATPYIVMQYVEGVTLRAVIQGGAVNLKRIANIIRQVGRALTTAHAKGILHRDLKPENIMLQKLGDDDEQVKIIDFGIAKVKDSKTALTTEPFQAVGTIAYMAPEQLQAESLTFSCDIYSMAVIAYELLTGSRPLNPTSAFQLLEMQRKGVQVRPSELRHEIPTLANQLILKALSFEPQRRYESAREFGDALADALSGTNEETLAPSPGQETIRMNVDAQSAFDQNSDGLDTLAVAGGLVSPSPQKKYLVTVATVVALVVLGLIAIGWYRTRWRTTDAEKPVENVAAAPAAIQQSVTYWLTVQTKKGNAFGKEFQSSGSEIYNSGSRFRFNLRPEQTGALYLLNEGNDDKGNTVYDILFPTPRQGGKANLNAQQVWQSSWNLFLEGTGVEKLWMLWSKEPITELDSIFSDAVKSAGRIDTSSAKKLKKYLDQFDSNPPTVLPLKEKDITVVSGSGSLIVNRVELSHKPY